MRIYHYTLVFATVFILIAATVGNYRHEDSTNSDQSGLWREALERAVDAAAQEMMNAGGNIYAARDWIADSFYGALTAYLNMAGENVRASTLQLYIPVLMITEEDGVYICSSEYYERDDGSTALYRNWTEKMPFCYEEDNYAYVFGRNDSVNIIDLNGNVSGGEADFSIAGLRERVVSEKVSGLLEFYCNRHNLAAAQAGIEYQFFLPDSALSEIKNISGDGFYALFQGYPVRNADGVIRNMFEFAGTRVDDCERYYVNLSGNGLGSKRYYHRKGCIYLTDDANSYVSRKECAEHGAFACEECCGY